MKDLVKKNGVLTQNGVVDRMNKEIDDKLNYVVNNLDNKDISKIITTKVVEDLIVENTKLNYRMSKIKLEYEITEFLKLQNSDKTVSSYKTSITDFVNYCNEKKIDILKIKVIDVDCYLNYLNSNYSPRSVRLKITS